MNFSLNDDHLALREAVHRFCEGEFPVPQRGNTQTPVQQMQRRKGMAELGANGLLFAAGFGGSEQSAVETMLVAQEFGRALADWSFVSSTVMAGQLLARIGSPAQQLEWLPALASGQHQSAMALYEDGARYQWNHVQCSAQSSGEGWVLRGHKTLVLGGDTADLLLVLARTSGSTTDFEGLSVFIVNAKDPSVQVRGFDTLDNRRAAHVELNDVKLHKDQLVGGLGNAASAVEAILDAANAALCAEAVGAVEALLEHTADHLRTRKQFGVPLAKFQVLQHRVADMAIALEQLKSMACAAAMAVQVDEPVQRARLVSAAKVLAGQKGREIGLAAIQLHGAMGMTDECRVGHYVKRLVVIGQMFGDAAWHLQRINRLTLA